MNKINYLDGSLNLIEGLKAIKYKNDFKKQHPEYFDPSGLLTFTGFQGSGKTLSLANYVYQLVKAYPKVVIVSNVRFFGFPEKTKIIYYESINDLIKLFSDVHNGYAGVIYVVDEIQTLFNNLLRRGQNVDVLEVISQQRKQRKHIVGTAQVYGRIDKVFREQMENVIICDNYFRVFTI